MRTLYLSLAAIILTCSILSCSNFLEEENPSGTTSESFYISEAGAEAGVKSCYTWMRQFYGKEAGYGMFEMGTDIFTSGDGDPAPELTRYTNGLQGTSNTITKVWEALYYALNTCNTVLSTLPQSSLSTSVKTVREGEVRFLRALYLWHIVNTWGGVELDTIPTTNARTELHRSTEDEFYRVIKSDLTAAISQLPATTTDYGRATKGAAEALMARVCLYSKDYQQALDNANHVIQNYNYQLAEDYNELCDILTCNASKENIFVCNFATYANNNFNSSVLEGPDGNMTIRDGGNNSHMLFTMLYDKANDRNGETPVKRCIEYNRPFNRFMPTLFFLDLFDEDIDGRYDAVIQQSWICNNKTSLCNVGDTAIVFTKKSVPESVENSSNAIIYDRDFTYGGENGGVTNRRWGPTFQKFLDPTVSSINQQSSPRDFVIIRLAEMYLIQAESQLQLGNKSAAAESINIIRHRAAKPGCESAMEIKESDVTIDFILDERARELCGEMQRWYDLKRTGKLLERNKLHNPDAAGIQEYHLYRPIPTTTLDAVTNKDEFKQNNGYN